MNSITHSAASRRQFLQTLGVAAGACLAGRVSPLFAEEDPFAGFKMGLQSYTLRAFNVDEALAHTKKLGLHYWESFSKHIPISTVPAHLDEAKAKLKAAGVQCLAFGVVGFDGNETKAREIFDFAKALGLASISADPNPDKETFDLLDKLVDEYGIPIAIHNHGPGHRYDKVADVLKVVKDRHPLVGACVDTGHYLRSDENPVEVIEALGARVFGVHLKDVRTVRDTAEQEKIAPGLPKHRVDMLKKEGKVFTVLGDGELDIAGTLKALRKLNYQNCLALEYEESEADPIADIQRCIISVKEAVKKLS